MDKADWINGFIETERLPHSYVDLARNYFIPFADHLVTSIQRRPREGTSLFIGVNGAQGTGKTTFAKFLSSYLIAFHDLNGSHISLDDFYLTRAERQERASEIHPLFLVRGVPGTHDTALAISTFEKLKTLKRDEEMILPSFDKANDDRKPEEHWPKAMGVQDFIIFEGWCVGSRPVPVSELSASINVLEKIEDPQGIWRNAVNDYLVQDYQKLFSFIDELIFLKAPNFTVVLEWRREQEEKIAAQHSGQSQIMSNDEVARFIRYFERITKDNLERLPSIADTVFEFDSTHQIISS
ncbi:MAG: P-loop NTPase fold protein [Litorimonas sp.]